MYGKKHCTKCHGHTSRTAVETSGSCSSLSNCLTHSSRRCSKPLSAGSFKTDFNLGNKLQNCNLILTTGSYMETQPNVNDEFS